MDAVPADTSSRLTRRSSPAWSRRRAPRSTDARTSARTTERNLHRIALALLLLATLGLRLWGIKQGLPYSYNSDEARHYVPRAIAYFSHDYNPNYFLNPPAYSYLLNIVFELWFGSADAVSRAYAADPTEVFAVARVVVAVLGTLSVWLTYLAGVRMFNRTVGLVAAAIFGLAFLPIFYSHLALNDTPTLTPVALALYGTAGVLRNGARRCFNSLRMHGLDGIHDQHARGESRRRADDVFHAGLGDQPGGGGLQPQSPGAKRDLLQRFLPGGIQHRS